MLRITKLADYGFVLLFYMAGRRRETTHNARDLATATQLPLPMVSKILKTLVRGSILASHRGTKGGYSLLRDPDQISAADIITALDGPISVTECLSPPDVSQCSYELLCPVKHSWERINEAVAGALHSITLAEMAAARCGCHEPQTTSRVPEHATQTQNPRTLTDPSPASSQ